MVKLRTDVALSYPLFSSPRSFRRIPHRLRGTFQESPPSIPVFLLRDHPLEWPWRLRPDDGLRQVLPGMSTRVRGRLCRLTHATKVVKVALEVAAPFFTWQERGRLCVTYSLAWLWRNEGVRVGYVLDTGKLPCVPSVYTSTRHSVLLKSDKNTPDEKQVLHTIQRFAFEINGKIRHREYLA